MKLLEYKQFNNSEEVKTLNKRKLTITIIILVSIIVLGIITTVYISNSNFRNFMDKYVLMKSVTENNLPYINIEPDANIYTYAYYNYIITLENDELKIYNTSADNIETLEINISSPIFASQDNYLVIAEKNQKKIYLIKDKKIVWEKEVDGQISRVNVNENGYVSVIVSGTSYKSVITTFAEDGAEVFKTFLSTTLAIDVDISKDNKYLSFCEMDLSGTLIVTKIKTVSIEKAKQDPSNSIINTYNIPDGEVVVNLDYHDRDELLCMCNNKIYLLKNGKLELLEDLTKNSVTFAGVKLSNSYFKVVENSYGVNNQTSNVEIYNTTKKKTSLYTINGIAKEVYSVGEVIAVNLGSEVYFIDSKGWLIKKYSSNQEVKKIIISDNVAGIIYRNKIEFVNL